MTPCPECNGGCWKETVSTIESVTETTCFELCPTCDGKGRVHAAQAIDHVTEIARRKAKRQGLILDKEGKHQPAFIPSPRGRASLARERLKRQRLPGNLPSDPNIAVRAMLRAEALSTLHPMSQFYRNLVNSIREEHRIALHRDGLI
jgi:hypothetical protein